MPTHRQGADHPLTQDIRNISDRGCPHDRGRLPDTPSHQFCRQYPAPKPAIRAGWRTDSFVRTPDLLADNAAFVPSGPTGADGGKICDGHGGSSVPPRPPHRRLGADGVAYHGAGAEKVGLEPILTNAASCSNCSEMRKADIVN